MKTAGRLRKVLILTGFSYTLAVGLLLSSLLISSTAFAEDSYTFEGYTVRVFGGNQGTVNGTAMVPLSGVGKDNKEKVTLTLAASNEKYVPRGIRETGKDASYDVSTIYSLQPATKEGVVTLDLSKIDKDTDYVVSYGLKHSVITYTVSFMNSATNRPMEGSQTISYYGNKGDVVRIPALYFDGYLPNAWNIEARIGENNYNDKFQIWYTRVQPTTTPTPTPTPSASGGSSSGGSSGGGTTYVATNNGTAAARTTTSPTPAAGTNASTTGGGAAAGGNASTTGSGANAGLSTGEQAANTTGGGQTANAGVDESVAQGIGAATGNAALDSHLNNIAQNGASAVPDTVNVDEPTVPLAEFEKSSSSSTSSSSSSSSSSTSSSSKSSSSSSKSSSSSSSIASSSSSSSSSSSTSATSTPTPEPTPAAGGISTTAKIGIGAGIGVVLGAVLGGLMMRRRRDLEDYEDDEDDEE